MEAAALTEQEEINKTRAGIRLMKQDVLGIKTDITEIKTAILGSAMTQDGGLVKRMYENESRVDKMDIRINEIEKEMTRRINEIEKTQSVEKENSAKNWAIGIGIFLALVGAIAAVIFK